MAPAGKPTDSVHYVCGCIRIRDVLFLCSMHVITFRRTLEKQ
jgi:hypothetical protein